MLILSPGYLSLRLCLGVSPRHATVTAAVARSGADAGARHLVPLGQLADGAAQITRDTDHPGYSASEGRGRIKTETSHVLCCEWFAPTPIASEIRRASHA